MVQVKKLTNEEYPLIVSMLEKKIKISNTPSSEWNWDTWDKNFEKYFEDPYTRVIGAFEEEKLTAFVVQNFMTLYPAWVMSLIGQESKGWLHTGHGDSLNACLLDATRVAESHGVFEVLYSVPTKWLMSTKKTQKTSPVWSRYNVYIDSIIPANETPKYSLQRKICGNEAKPHDRAIKKCMLKMEHRLIHLNLDNKYNYN